MLVWIIIYLSNGYFPKEHISSYFKIAFMLFIVMLVALKNKKRDLNKRITAAVVVFATLQCITMFINGMFIALDLNHFGIVVAGALFVCVIEEKEFIRQYRQGVIYVCLISVILYFSGLAGLFTKIPKAILLATSRSNMYTLCGIFTIQIPQKWTYYRNFGLFSEPGQYQIFIVVALFIELFAVEKKDWKRIVVYIITLITCNSTNGFVSASLVFIAFLCDRSKLDDLDTKRIRRAFGVVVALLVVFLLLYGDNLESISHAKDKIFEFLFQEYSYDDMGTGIERRKAASIAVDCFFMNPLFGLGFNGMEVYLSSLSSEKIIMTFSPFNWFARFGLIYGLLTNISFFGYYFKFAKKRIGKALLLLGLVAMISAQAVNSDILTWISIFYFLKKPVISRNLVEDVYEEKEYQEIQHVNY